MARNYRYDIIDENDYYLCNGMGHLLLGAKLYSEAESAYASMSHRERCETSRFIPVMTDIKWSGRLLWVKKHREETEVIPDKFIREWLQRQRKKVRKNILSQEKTDALNTIVPKGFRVRNKPYLLKEDAWDSHLSDVVEFVEAKGRLPRDRAEYESKLATWLSNQKTDHRLGILAANRIDKLDRDLPMWRIRHRERYDWEDMLDDVHSFVLQHGTLPKRSKDAEEHRLAKWVARQREARRPPSPERVALLNEKIPGWDL